MKNRKRQRANRKWMDRACACQRTDCFACTEGYCAVLTSSDFGGRSCPFYKAAEDANQKEGNENGG